VNEEEFMNKLIAGFPELKPYLDEHLADQEGEMLPYLLMGDVARWAHEQASREPDLVSRLTQWLDAEFASGEGAIKDLIGVGFVEMLPETPRGDAVLDVLGPELTVIARDMNLFEPWT
jgi:hypothetical protein